MSDDADAARKARLAAIRAAAEAEAAAEGDEPKADEAQERSEEPVVKFRSYVPRNPAGLTFERVAPTLPPELEQPEVLALDPEALPEPRRENWDVRRDLAPALAELDRQAQAAIRALAKREEERRAAVEEGT